MAAAKDAVLDAAVDLARQAAEAVAGDPALVGEHLGRVVEGERLVSHRFASTAEGYPGWAWTVTLARVPRGRVATVAEVDLLPGENALLAPAWVPWSERLRPGDLGPGDVLPYQEQDDRLDQGYEATGDEDADRVAIVELGLGRTRVLSAYGRAQAADRWYRGSHGPMAPGALAAAAPCSTCGFLVLMAGSLRTEFGVCANEWSPDDGRVVSMDHGCGAHSETEVVPPATDWPDPLPAGEPLELVRLADEPVADEPVADDEPVLEASVVDEPVLDEPVLDEPVLEEPSVDDEPVVEAESIAETEPVLDQPVAEPVLDETPADQA